jgi:hypothetical protein
LACRFRRAVLSAAAVRLSCANAAVSEWQDGTVKRITNYSDIDEARAAAERLAQERGQAMSRENARVQAVERFVKSLIAGEPDMTLVTEGFEYEQRFGSTEGLYGGEAGLRRWLETFYEIWDQARALGEYAGWAVRAGSGTMSPRGSPHKRATVKSVA